MYHSKSVPFLHLFGLPKMNVMLYGGNAVSSWLPVILPLTAVIGVVSVVIALGLTFTALGPNGTIALGLLIIIVVPAVGALLTRLGGTTPE